MKLRSSQIKTFRIRIAAKIIALRQKSGLTQEAMKKSGIGYRTYQRMEKEGPHSLAQFFKIAKALGVKPFKLMDK